MAYHHVARQRTQAVALILVGLAILAASIGLSIGSVSLTWTDFFAALFGHGVDIDRQIIWQLRFPRVMAGFATGALLAVAGTLLQAMLRNPLADPYILGTAGGAGVAALSAIALGASTLWTNLGAFIGSLAATFLVFGLAGGTVSRAQNLLLTGVMIAAGCGAVISFLLVTSDSADLPAMLFWLIGDLSHVQSPWHAVIGTAVIVAAAVRFGSQLDRLAQGELFAVALGVRVQRVYAALYALAALATALAVTVAGTMGFIGLIVPHLLRLAGIQRHGPLLLLAPLAGGSLLVLADVISRTVLAPRELPVGIVTAAVGIPIFFILLRRHSHG